MIHHTANHHLFQLHTTSALAERTIASPSAGPLPARAVGDVGGAAVGLARHRGARPHPSWHSTSNAAPVSMRRRNRVESRRWQLAREVAGDRLDLGRLERAVRVEPFGERFAIEQKVAAHLQSA